MPIPPQLCWRPQQETEPRAKSSTGESPKGQMSLESRQLLGYRDLSMRGCMKELQEPTPRQLDSKASSVPCSETVTTQGLLPLFSPHPCSSPSSLPRWPLSPPRSWLESCIFPEAFPSHPIHSNSISPSLRLSRECILCFS